VASASMAFFVNFKRGMEEGSRRRATFVSHR
jgi:hypothetical protein